jgi:hypothetical protein
MTQCSSVECGIGEMPADMVNHCAVTRERNSLRHMSESLSVKRITVMISRSASSCPVSRCCSASGRSEGVCAGTSSRPPRHSRTGI